MVSLSNRAESVVGTHVHVAKDDSSNLAPSLYQVPSRCVNLEVQLGEKGLDPFPLNAMTEDGALFQVFSFLLM